MRNYVEDAERLPEQLRVLAMATDTTRLQEVTAGARRLGQRRLRQRRAAGVAGGLLAVALLLPVAGQIRSHSETAQIVSSTWAGATGAPRGDLADRSDLSAAAQRAWNADLGAHRDVRVVFSGTMPGATGRVLVLAGLDRQGQQRLGVVGDDVVPSGRPVSSMAVLHDLPAPGSAAAAVAVTIVGAQPAQQLDQPLLTLLVVGGPDAVSANWTAAGGGGPLTRAADGVFAMVLSAPDALGARVAVVSVGGASQQIVPQAPDGALEAPAPS